MPSDVRAMLLDLSQMRGTRDRFERTYAPSAFEPAGEDYRIVQPVTLALDVVKRNTKFTLVGRVTTALELRCSRCLEAFAMPVDVGFDLLYLPHSENTGEGEVEIEEDDLGTAFYRNEVIDLGQLMKEQFYLTLPMKPLCQETCRGLCPHCGTNLNQSSCNCVSTWIDPRLQGMRSLGRDGRSDE
jgi:uncharacterized protein